jgi:hypothetical protein
VETNAGDRRAVLPDLLDEADRRRVAIEFSVAGLDGVDDDELDLFDHGAERVKSARDAAATSDPPPTRKVLSVYRHSC